jgi:hypothetical protein
MNLYQKIVEVRKVAEGFTKDGASYSYTYVTGNQVLGKIKDKMNELNLLLFPSTKIGEHHTHAYKTAKGKDVLDFVVKGEMSYTWINGDEPSEREVVSWAYYGQQDDISKAFGSALTYSERYFLLKCLGLPTDEDDPDAKQDKPQHNSQQSQTPPKATQQPSQTNTQSSQYNASQSQQGAVVMVSEGQIKFIGSLKTQKKVPDDDYRQMIAPKTSTKDLTMAEAKKLINTLQDYTPQPVTTIADDDLPF